jgi:hypothetical protein
MGKKRAAPKGTAKTESGKKASASAGTLDAQGVSREDRLEMIRTAAYHLAEKRGFQPGAAMDDWLEAERDLKDTVTADDF